MNSNNEPAKNPIGPEEGLRSGSAAGDSHGATADSPEQPVETKTDPSGLTPGERREQELKQP